MRHWFAFVLMFGTPAGAVAAGSDLPPLVGDIGVSLLLAGVLAVLFARTGIPEIAAFLVAGILAGPIGFGLVTDPANIDTIAQLGLILLLFMVGLELDRHKIAGCGRALLLAGVLQYPLCVLFSVLVIKALAWLGLGASLFGASPFASLYTGFVVAASSTLLVVKLFQEHFQLDTQAGRIALALLIFQDLWAVVVIALQPNFADLQTGPVIHSFLGIATLGVLSFAVARWALPPAFGWIAKLPEVVLVAALGWCFLVVVSGLELDRAVHLVAEPGYPLAVGAGMGALIAGASIANLPYSMEIIGKVRVVKDFFVTLFFVGLGMGIPRPDGADMFVLALVFVVLTLVARLIVFIPLLHVTGTDRLNSVVASSRLAQVSEFSLVIGFLGLQLGHVEPAFNSAIVFAFVITAVLTPTLYRQADRIHTALGPLLDGLGIRLPANTIEEPMQSYQLAILGFHRIASSLLVELGRTSPALLERTLVVDFNVALHKRIAAMGVTVRYGDLGNSQTLSHAGIDRARIVLCTVPDDLLKGTSNLHLVEAVRALNPGAIVIVNAIRTQDVQPLYEAGADYVLLPRIESARALGDVVELALNGQLDTCRSRIEHQDPSWRERGEVLD